ncbi:hypothetical protein AAMO2058_000751300 [Amorphochlora amoebiformis]
MVSRSHFSGLLIIAGLITFFAVGAILYDLGEYSLLSWCVVISGSVVLLGGLQWHLLTPPLNPYPPEKILKEDESSENIRILRSKGSFAVGMRVSGIVGLFIFAVTSLLCLCYIFVNLHVNAPYRVDFGKPDTLSPHIRTRTTSNGFSYSYLRTPHKRGKFSVALRIGVGSLADPPGQIGLAGLAQRVSLDSSNLYPARYGVYSAFQSLGAQVAHTHTLPRSTLFIFTDIPASLTNLELTFALIKEVAMSQRPVDAQVRLERRILRGETERKRSRSALVSRLRMCAHFGPDGPVCARLRGSPANLEGSNAGTTGATPALGAAEVEAFLEKWYRPSRLTLHFFGDIEYSTVDSAVSRVFGEAMRGSPVPDEATSAALIELGTSVQSKASKPISRQKALLLEDAEIPGPMVGEPSPRPLSILTREGFHGLDMSLVVSSAYKSNTDANDHRRTLLDKAFYAAFLNRYMSRVLDETDKDSEVHVSSFTTNSYELGRLFHTVALTLGGHPEKGGWRRAVEVFLVELRRLAEHGPDKRYVGTLLTTAEMVLKAKKAFSTYEDGAQLASAMAHTTDPKYLYQDAVQSYETRAPFCNEGIVESAARHLQSHAQLLFKHFVQAVNRSAEFEKPPYSGLNSLSASLTIITDPMGSTNYGGDDFDASGGGTSSYITHAALARLVNKVLDAVIAPLHFPSVIHAEDIFMQDESTNAEWIPRHHTSDGDVEKRYLHSHLANSGPGGATEKLDGLPSGGTLVEYSRLSLLPKSLSSSEYANASKPLPPLQPYSGPGYRFLDAFSSSGVKRYELSNGLKVNLKPRMSGTHMLPCDAPGLAWIEVVSLGGRAVQPPSLLGACELVSLNVPSGFTVEYWGGRGRSAKLEREFFDIHTVDQYARDTGRPRLRCEAEAFVIRKRLHPKCVNFPQVSRCDVSTFNYERKLEAIRLALSPSFDEQSIDQAAQLLEHKLLLDTRSGDPDTYLSWRVEKDLQAPWHASGLDGGIDPRLRRVTPNDIKALDPVKVGAWVREQFTANRMEVNVAGDFDAKTLLTQLDKTLGTMPLRMPPHPPARHAKPPRVHRNPKPSNRNTESSARNPDVSPRNPGDEKNLGGKGGTILASMAHPISGKELPEAPVFRTRERIGFDIYNPRHERHLALRNDADTMGHEKDTHPLQQDIESLPTSQDTSLSTSTSTSTSTGDGVGGIQTTTNCSLAGLFPGRAFISAAIRTHADFEAVRGHHRALLADHAFRSTILNVLRRDNGYVASVDSDPFTSSLVKGLGFYRVRWCVALGEDAAPSKSSSGKGQVEASVRALHDLFSKQAMRRPFEKSTFLISKSSLLSTLEAELQEAGAWLGVLRGISLRPPAWFEGHRVDLETLKDIAETDVLGAVSRVKFEEVSSWFSRHLSGSSSEAYHLSPSINVAIVQPVSSEVSAASQADESPNSLILDLNDGQSRASRGGEKERCVW